MTAPASALQPQRTIDELKKLRALTGDPEGAQRVAFTDTWATARAWMERSNAFWSSVGETAKSVFDTARISGRTVTVKVRLHDFTTHSRLPSTLRCCR